MKRFTTSVEPRRLTLNAPHATEASVPVDVRLYHLLPAGKSWRFCWPDRPLLVPPFPTWTLEFLWLLVREVETSRPHAEPARIGVELVRWGCCSQYRGSSWKAAPGEPASRSGGAYLALEHYAVSEDAIGDRYTFTPPMLDVFEDWHARSPFVVSTVAAASASEGAR